MRKFTIRGHLGGDRHHHEGSPSEPEIVEIRASDLGGLFAAPPWLRNLGISSWLLAGAALVVCALMALLTLTQAIVAPVLTAAIIAAVLSPVVRWLARGRLPRGAATAVVLLAIILVGCGVGLLVMTGITSQSAELTAKLSAGAAKVQSWLQDLGVKKPTAAQANETASNGVSDGFHALLGGLTQGVEALAGLAIFISFTILSLIFLLKDGPQIRAWTERNLGLPRPLARTITGRVLGSMRGYFAGVTVIALFNATLVGLGALILGVPLAGSIAVVTFVGAYIPYLGAWTAGAFSVLVALGTTGTDAAIAIAIISLLANGILQQMIQPIAMGATLGIHPLAVLIVTIAGGALFGMIGLVLAAPLTSAAVKIAADVAKAKAEVEPPDPPGPEPSLAG